MKDKERKINKVYSVCNQNALCSSVIGEEAFELARPSEVYCYRPIYSKAHVINGFGLFKDLSYLKIKRGFIIRFVLCVACDFYRKLIGQKRSLAGSI